MSSIRFTIALLCLLFNAVYCQSAIEYLNTTDSSAAGRSPVASATTTPPSIHYVEITVPVSPVATEAPDESPKPSSNATNSNGSEVTLSGSSIATTTTSSDDDSTSTQAPKRSKHANATKVNWEEIEKIWQQTKADNIVTSKWANLESGMKKGNDFWPEGIR